MANWAPFNDRRPLAHALPNVGNIALTESSASMSYNALQVSGRHALTGGLSWSRVYVWSKSIMDNLGYYGCAAVNTDGAYWQDAYNRKANSGPACFDARHNSSIGGLYDMPFGKGKKFGSGMNKAADLILGGWKVNYFLNTHSGFPVTMNASSGATTPAHSCAATSAPTTTG